jgi:tetratricopeptide (TPR) repeat protein
MRSTPPDSAAGKHVFRTADVARILGTTPTRVRSMVRTGLCRPASRGRTLEFGFQDLVLLRTAHGLLQASVPARRVRRALDELARQLPADRPLSGVRIYADGQQVVARDGRAAWRPDSGQIVFTFEIDDLARKAGAVVPVRRQRPRAAQTRPEPFHEAAEWFERALLLEQEGDPVGARTAYCRAVELDPEMGDAYINLGRLVHEGGNAVEAARLYHLALERAPEDPVAHYNLALALEDESKTTSAALHYQRALDLDHQFADAHFNLGRLLERLGRRSEAMQHLLAYKRLTDKK